MNELMYLLVFKHVYLLFIYRNKNTQQLDERPIV